MLPTALGLVIAVPMQLAAAAGVEVTGGYDSTVANLLARCTNAAGVSYTGCYVDGGILRTAIDVQVGHRTETLRHVLRTRGELYYSGGDGRDFGQSDLLSLNNYTAAWAPSDDWAVNLSALYNVGQGALLFQRTSDPSLRFLRGVFGEYGAQVGVGRTFSDSARLGINADFNGRHTIEIPEGAQRADQMQVTGGLTGSLEVRERNTLGLTANVSGIQIDGLGGWLLRMTSFLTWRRAWSETIGTTLSAGVDTLQSQTDLSRSTWSVGPYAGVTYQHVFPEARLAFVLGGNYQFSPVNAVRCADDVPAGSPCPTGSVVSGGAGRVVAGSLQLLWRPLDDNLVFTATLGADYGVTDNFVEGSVAAGAPATQSVDNFNFDAGLGGRWIITRGASVFARYNFLFQHVEVPDWFPDIVRHVMFVGVTLSAFAGDAEEILGVTPLEEVAVAQAIRNASAESPGAGGGDDNGGAFDDSIPGDEGGSSVDDSTSRPPQAEEPGRPRQPRQPEQTPAPTGRPLQPGQTAPPIRPTPGASEGGQGSDSGGGTAPNTVTR